MQIILEFIAYNLAGILVLVVPMSVLVATIMAFGRLSSDNEVTALKAGGIHFLKLVLPVIIVSGCLTVALFLFNDRILPVANHNARVLKRNIQAKRPTLSIEPGIFLEGIENFSLIVDNKDELGSAIYGVTIFDKTQRHEQRTITAKSGQLVIDEADESMILTLDNGEIHEVQPHRPNSYRKIVFSKYKVVVPVENLSIKRTDESFHNEREKSSGQLMEDVSRYKAEKDKNLARVVETLSAMPELAGELNDRSRSYLDRHLLEKTLADHVSDAFTLINLPDDTVAYVTTLTDSAALAVQAALADTSRKPTLEIPASIISPTGRPLGPGIDSVLVRQKFNTQQIVTSLNSANNYQRLMDQIMVEVNKKYSIPMACIVFVMLGAPLGVKARRGNLGIAGGISLFFFIAYYFCLILGENLADRQLLNPFFAMWFMNFILGLLGLILIYQTTTETDFGFISSFRTVGTKIKNLAGSKIRKQQDD